MKILAFAGSNSSQSINLKLVKHSLTYFKDAEINLLNLNDFEMPIYSMDREKRNEFPKEAHLFIEQITNCDCIIVSLAEHNRTYTVAFKNIFDWCSRIDAKYFKNKPMLLMSTSPGGFGGGNVMAAAKGIFPNFAAEVVETFSLPSFTKNFDDATGITNPELKTEFESKITKFKERINS